MVHKKGTIHFFVQMDFIQRKQFSEANITSYAFLHTSDLKIFSWMLLKATENAVAGHMRPAGL